MPSVGTASVARPGAAGSSLGHRSGFLHRPPSEGITRDLGEASGQSITGGPTPFCRKERVTLVYLPHDDTSRRFWTFAEGMGVWPRVVDAVSDCPRQAPYP